MLDSDTPGKSIASDPGQAGYFFIALAAVLAIFVLPPLELYTNAAEYWRWNTNFPLSFIAAGGILYAGVLLFLFALSLVSINAFRGAALALFYLGILVLLADVLAPLQTGLLDGSALESDEPLFYTVIELFLLALVLFLAVKLRSHAITIGVIMTTFLLIISVVYVAYASLLHAPQTFGPPEIQAHKSARGNIYHIVLDEMQSDATIAHIEQDKLQAEFEGFTLYPSNIANYLFTNVSMPSYMTGKLFESGDFSKWQLTYKDTGLFRRMYEEGFTVQLYAVYDHWCSPFAQSCQSLDEIFEHHTGLLGSDYITFIQIWFARIAPNFLSNRALVAGKKLGDYVDARMNASAEGIPRTISRGRAPYSSVLMLDDLISAESDEPDKGRYVHAHAIIPHGPYVMNKECDYDAALWKTLGGKQAYYQQVQCALNKVVEFLAELKRLGRYRDATIIVHADTGHGHQGFIEPDENGEISGEERSPSPPVKLDDKFIKTQEWYLSRAMALLMVKPPGAGGEMIFSNDPAQLIDVYPAILEMAGISPADGETTDGRPLSTSGAAVSREAHMYFTTSARPGEVTTLTISDQGNIPASRLIIQNIDRHAELANRYSVTLGQNDSALVLSGFSHPERDQNGSHHWRWATGGESRIDLTRQLRLEQGSYILEFELEPFTVNAGTVLGVSIGGYRQEIELEQGWQTYQLQFDFKQVERALIQFHFDKSASPYSLGMSADKRELSARIQRLDIRPAG